MNRSKLNRQRKKPASLRASLAAYLSALTETSVTPEQIQTCPYSNWAVHYGDPLVVRWVCKIGLQEIHSHYTMRQCVHFLNRQKGEFRLKESQFAFEFSPVFPDQTINI